MSTPATQALAATLVIAGGSGTQADVDAIRPEIARLSEALLQALIKKGAHVVACRGAVTDVATNLRGKHPRGWKAVNGVMPTWDIVPGTYLSSGKRVILATVAASDGGRRMPGNGEGHGSVNVALHETLHGHDYLGGHKPSKTKGFAAARAADLARLPEYLRQAGAAGREETYAESGARFFGGDPDLAADWPALFAYWSGAPIPPAPPALAGGLAAREIEGGAFGQAELAGDGTLLLDLRAEGRGAVGHALVRVAPDDPAYAEARAQAFPRRGRARPTLLRPPPA
jgi:Anthrax toxin lethal factor, N- and C-terminal domain